MSDWVDRLPRARLSQVPPWRAAQLVDALREQFGAVIDAASPARLVSTRMSTLASVESTEEGWQHWLNTALKKEWEKYALNSLLTK